MVYSDVSEEEYRSQYQKQDRAQSRKVIRLVMWAFLPLILVDLDFHGFSVRFGVLLALRGLVLAYSWWTLRQFARLEDAEKLDRYMLYWVVAELVMQLISNVSLPRDYFGHYMVDIWLSLMIFIVVPLPLQNLRPPVMGFVACSIVMLLYKQVPAFSYAVTVALMQPASAITGNAIAMYVHRYRRKLVSAEAELDRQVNTDPVTGVANWREFMRIADAEVQRHARLNKPLSILVLSLDDFREINEMQGPHVGDVILVEVTRRIKRAMRTYDCLARYGADEFCLLLPEANPDDAEKIAERTRATVVAIPVSVYGKEMRVVASTGVATLQAGDTTATLLHRANMAKNHYPA
ncbi:MAG: GGDEF domain-containing protein [Burkholderiales bacterium]|nr:GGDEF domain-containing protein [Burkholderiales bacterium]